MELRPDSMWSCLVCAASLLSILIVSGGAYNFGILLPPLMDHFNTTRQATAWIGSLNLACGYFLAPFSLYLADRYGYRVTNTVGALSGILGFFLASFSTNLWMMYPTYGLLSGFGHRTIYSASMLVVLQYFVKWRSVAVGIITSATAVAMFAITQITNVLLNAFGWRWAIRGFACLYFICGLSSNVYLPISDLHKGNNDDQKKPKSSVMRSRSFLVFIASTTTANFSYYIPVVHIVEHCKQELQISEETSVMVFTYYAIASFVSRHFFCKLGDFVNRFYIYQFTLTVTGISIICLPWAKTFESVVGLFIVSGLMDGGSLGQLSLLLLKCVDKEQVNRAWGYLMLFTGFGIGIGPPLAGLIADELGSYNVAFYIAGSVLIAGGSMILLLKLTKQPVTEGPQIKTFQPGTEEVFVVEKVTAL